MKRIFCILSFVLLFPVCGLAQEVRTLDQQSVRVSWMGMPQYSTTSTPGLGAELVTNGDMSVPASWTNEVPTKIFLSGSSCFFNGTTSNDGIYQNTAAAYTGNIIKAQYTVSNYSSGAFRFANVFGFNEGANLTGDGTKILYGVATASTEIRFADFSAGANFVVDDISVRPLSLPSLLAPTRPFSGSGRFYTTATTANCATGEWLGTAAYVDDTRNPTKGVFAYLNRATGNAELRVLTAANTWTSLINTAVTFSSGAQLVLVVDHNQDGDGKPYATLFYNGAIVGTRQDLSSYTWVKTNRRHAIFSTTAVTPGSVTYDYGQIVLGSDLLAGWDFTSGWGTAGAGSVVDANTFTSAGGIGGITKNLLTTGSLYKVSVNGSRSAGASTLAVRDTIGDWGTEHTSPVGIHKYDIAKGPFFYLRAADGNTWDFTLLVLRRVQ